jgi:predicted nucleic acid-binding protein
MIVADATLLIHLSRAGLAHLLPKLYQGVVVPRSVWAEAAERGGPRAEAHVLEEAREHWLEVRELSPKQRKTSESLRRGAPVGQGEADVIALASALGSPALMDDRVAINLARMKGVQTRWTTTVVLEARSHEILSPIDARHAIEDLIASGLWIRQDVLLRILAALSEG